LENLSVRQNVELALMYRGMAKEARLRQVSEILERIGLTERGDHRPQQLSGGQQQRVAIARAVVGRPAVIFADEPTGNLDTTNGDEVMRLIGELNIAGTTVVRVTHSKTESERADRVIQMLDGKIVS
jgi:putative ABC transport system ATP-binding protein